MRNVIIKNTQARMIVEEIVDEIRSTDIPDKMAAELLTDISTLLQEAALELASIEEQGHKLN